MSSRETSWHRHQQDLMSTVFALLALCFHTWKVVSCSFCMYSGFFLYPVICLVQINFLVPKCINGCSYHSDKCYYMIHVTGSLRSWALHVIITLSIVEEHLTVRLVIKQGDVKKVKVTWHCGQVWLPILGICALHLTFPKCTHTAVNTHTPWTWQNFPHLQWTFRLRVRLSNH